MHIALRVPTSGQPPSRGHNQMQVWARADMPKHSEPCPKCFGDWQGIAGDCQNVRLAWIYARSLLCVDVETSKHDSRDPDPLHPRSVRSLLHYVALNVSVRVAPYG